MSSQQLTPGQSKNRSKLLNLEIELNKKTSQALRGKTVNESLNITEPSYSKTYAEEISDKFGNQQKTLDNLYKILNRDIAQEAQQWLIQNRDIDEFNAFYPALKREFENLKGLNLDGFKAVWRQFKQKYTGISAPPIPPPPLPAPVLPASPILAAPIASPVSAPPILSSSPIKLPTVSFSPTTLTTLKSGLKKVGSSSSSTKGKFDYKAVVNQIISDGGQNAIELKDHFDKLGIKDPSELERLIDDSSSLDVKGKAKLGDLITFLKDIWSPKIVISPPKKLSPRHYAPVALTHSLLPPKTINISDADPILAEIKEIDNEGGSAQQKINKYFNELGIKDPAELESLFKDQSKLTHMQVGTLADLITFIRDSIKDRALSSLTSSPPKSPTKTITTTSSIRALDDFYGTLTNKNKLTYSKDRKEYENGLKTMVNKLTDEGIAKGLSKKDAEKQLNTFQNTFEKPASDTTKIGTNYNKVTYILDYIIDGGIPDDNLLNAVKGADDKGIKHRLDELAAERVKKNILGGTGIRRRTKKGFRGRGLSSVPLVLGVDENEYPLRGYEKLREEKFAKFGNCYINTRDILKGYLTIRSSGKKYIKGRPSVPISKELQSILLELVLNGRFEADKYDKLDDKEKIILDDSIQYSKLVESGIVNHTLHSQKERTELLKRLEILKDSILAGNNSADTLKEIRNIILTLRCKRYIKKQHFENLLTEVVACL